MIANKQTVINPNVTENPGYNMPQYKSQPPGPVIEQPVQAEWIAAQQGLIDCPPGLEYLSVVDTLLIHQEIEVLEVISGYERNNRYTIKNSVGQKVYFAKEETDCCSRNCCGSGRTFHIKIFDNFENEVIHLFRPCSCGGCCCPCCLESVQVFSPPGKLIGTVKEMWTLCKPCFVIKDVNKDVVLKIRGPICTCSCCGDVDFQIYSKEGSVEVGKIIKQWSGFFREAYTDADNFGVRFPMDLDVKMKALLLGATFLIDFMFFESN